MRGYLHRGLKRGLGLLSLAALLCSLSAAGQAASPEAKASLDPANSSIIVLAGGCFWGVQAVFQHVKGVQRAVSGYAGGDAETAHYDQVSTGTTGHAESVEVIYDPKLINLEQILKVYFSVAHDPTELNRQGPDTGTQYRSAVFTMSAEQKKTVEDYIAKMQQAKFFPAPIVTKIETLKGFYAAEDHHQNYYKLHPDSPYIVINDQPKVAALKKKFPELYVEP